jgi:hypothetical protein
MNALRTNRLPGSRGSRGSMSVLGSIGALALLLAVPLAYAHHSAAMFDFSKVGEASGTVKAIRVINPHMSLTLAVSDEKGPRDIDYEGHSINNFYRAGWRPNMIKVGDKIKIRFAPRKDGQDGGFVSGFTTADGQVVAFGVPKEANQPPAAK